MPQIAIVVSDASRRTSNSISYQPSRLSARRAPGRSGWRPARSRFARAPRRRCSANPPPPPPSVKAGRTTIGAFRASTKRIPSSSDLDHRRLGHRLADARHQRPEAAAVLGGPHGRQRRAEHADAVPLEHPGVVERDGQVEAGLPAERGSNASGWCSSITRVTKFQRQRPDDHRAAHVRIGHHGGRVRVDQDRLDALGPQREAGLDAGIVELRGLPDEDRPRADDEDLSPGRVTPAPAPRPGRRRAPRRSAPAPPRGGTGPMRSARCRAPTLRPSPSLRSRWLTA